MRSYANDRGGDDDDREGLIACRTRFAFLAGCSFYYAYVCERGNEDLFVPIETLLCRGIRRKVRIETCVLR